MKVSLRYIQVGGLRPSSSQSLPHNRCHYLLKRLIFSAGCFCSNLKWIWHPRTENQKDQPTKSKKMKRLSKYCPLVALCSKTRTLLPLSVWPTQVGILNDTCKFYLFSDYPPCNLLWETFSLIRSYYNFHASGLNMTNERANLPSHFYKSLKQFLKVEKNDFGVFHKLLMKLILWLSLVPKEALQPDG